MGGGRSATGQVDPTRRHSGCTAETCSTWCSAGSDDAEFNATATCADANLRGRKTTSGKERGLNMGLGDWFGTFCSNIQVQDSGTISTRYKAITRRLNTDFWDTTSETAHSLYVGSYGRNTAIQGFSDLDIVFELPSYLYHQYDGYVTNGQSALLQAVRSSMQRTYPTSEILGGHRKSGHRGSPQNRPTGRGQDMRLLYRVGGRRGKKFLNGTVEPCHPRYTGFTWAEDSGNAGMRPERRPRCRNGGAASSRPRSQPFWRESDKSQGVGDRVPPGALFA